MAQVADGMLADWQKFGQAGCLGGGAPIIQFRGLPHSLGEGGNRNSYSGCSQRTAAQDPQSTRKTRQATHVPGWGEGGEAPLKPRQQPVVLGGLALQLAVGGLEGSVRLAHQPHLRSGARGGYRRHGHRQPCRTCVRRRHHRGCAILFSRCRAHMTCTQARIWWPHVVAYSWLQRE